ncbi:MAG: PP2C family protein-serine/threonine phosphatase [Bacteroides sp.]|nr:PP2C family protein-serine/threonine phosphatase [Prevotella sp.]MCM1407671.1 PP2C family protein-serine/threonine phosphatase [Treponema brennaborense]MCM1469179.1 PP2C family protein-serine/threonine phosphatase [Bacteroides sp.]
MHITPALQMKLQLLAHHISACTEILYTDALLLKLIDLANYVLPVISEAAEIRRIIAAAVQVPPDTKIFEEAVREELSRRCYIIRFRLNDIPVQIPEDIELPPDARNNINYLRQTISRLTAELTAYCKQIFGITTEAASGISVDNLQNQLDTPVAQYFSADTRASHAAAGNIVIMGENGKSSALLRPLFTKAGFRTIVLTQNDSLNKTAEQLDIYFICYDCGSKYEQSYAAYLKMMQTPELEMLPYIVCGDTYSDEIAMRFLKNSAIDYFSPGRSLELLFSRIQSISVWHRSGYYQQLYMRALEIDRHSIAKEFRMASEYVTALLPPRISSKSLTIDWAFLPSIELGGDIFGYGMLSNTETYLYLLDVSGHGLGASLYSVTIMNLLKHRLLRNADFSNPAEILMELNRTFDMESQNNMFFTVWYGVYDIASRKLRFSSAGSPPAFLFFPSAEAEKISTNGAIIGADEDFIYKNDERDIPPDSKLYVFSDGIFEIQDKNGCMMAQDTFFTELKKHSQTANETCLQFVRRIETLSKNGQFDDDVSLLEITFK